MVAIGGRPGRPRRLGAPLLFALAGVLSGTVALSSAPASAVGSVSQPNQLARSEAVAVFTRINAVRRAFHLAPGHLTDAFQGVVSEAAATDRDPVAPLGGNAIVEYGVWGLVTFARPASVVNIWVYRDGWDGAGTSNLDCTSATAPGCNGHRRAILSTAPVRGARLYIDVATSPMSWHGASGTSVAALLFWVMPR